MQISIINDCFDENAKVRQISRAGALFPQAGVNCFAAGSELEAAGLLVDALDAFERRPGIILANVAPRSGEAKKFSNGTPFGYFRYGETLVVASVDGLMLSLVRKLDLISKLYVLDIAAVMASIPDSELDARTKERTIKTQFRSFNFLPRAADWIWRGYDLPKMELSLEEIDSAPSAVWYIDNFGNVKTTLVGADCRLNAGQELEVSIDGVATRLKYYDRLKDLPDRELGIVEGSSGIEDRRFLELIFQGGSAARHLDLGIGAIVKI
jgi:hypothetical protein